MGPPLRLLAAAAVLIATVWLAAAPAASAGAAASPFVLAPGVGLYDQFGYAPAYTRNVPAFDEAGRAYIRSRTSSGSATSYVHTREAGSWMRLDFLAALRAAYPSFVQTVGAGGLRNDGLVFDRQGRAYNPVTLQVRDGSTRNALLVSWDHCRTWKVFELPQGTFTTERWVGHNELDGPPFLAVWRTSAPPDLPGSQTNTLYVTQPRLEGDQLVLPPLVKVTDRASASAATRAAPRSPSPAARPPGSSGRDRARRQGRHAALHLHLRPRDRHGQRTAQAGHLPRPQRPARQARHLPGQPATCT